MSGEAVHGSIASDPATGGTGHGPTRALIIGCGIIGKHHAQVITQHPAFAVTALVDPDPATADDVADTVVADGGQRPTSYPSIRAALDSGEVDLAVVCTPSGYHIDHAEQVLAADVGVVIEKPLDVSVARGRQFARAAAEAAERGLLVSVISQHRFDPGNMQVHRTLDAGGFGRLTSAVATMAWYRSQQYYDSGSWRGTWALDGGGAIMNQGVHTVDLLRWFCGRPVEIFAHAARLAHEGIEVEDTATATVSFESGALAVIHGTTAAYPGLTARVQVHGVLGSAIVDNDESTYFHAGDGQIADNLREAKTVANQIDHAPSGASAFTSSRNEPDAFLAGHLRQYDDLAAALSDNRPPLVTVDEALLSLALVRSLYVSATLGGPVRFDDVLDGHYDDVAVSVAHTTGPATSTPAGTAAGPGARL